MSYSKKEQFFIDVYRIYFDEVYRYIFVRAGLNPTIAEDITQEVFLDVFKGLDKFKGLCSERTWVFKIARNKLYDFYRKQYGQHFESICMDDETSVQISDSKQDIEWIMERAYESECISVCMNRLPQHYKLTLLLKYVDGRSVKEIAAITDKSCKSIDNILQRAKSAFIKQFRMMQVEDKPHEK